MHGSVSQALGTAKFMNLIEIDIESGLDFPI